MLPLGFGCFCLSLFHYIHFIGFIHSHSLSLCLALSLSLSFSPSHCISFSAAISFRDYLLSTTPTIQVNFVFLSTPKHFICPKRWSRTTRKKLRKKRWKENCTKQTQPNVCIVYIYTHSTAKPSRYYIELVFDNMLLPTFGPRFNALHRIIIWN